MVVIWRMAAISRADISCLFICGTAIAAITRMIAITINSSISVKPRRLRWRCITIILDVQNEENVEMPGKLMNSLADALAVDQFIENSQHLFAVGINTLEFGLDGALITMAS